MANMYSMMMTVTAAGCAAAWAPALPRSILQPAHSPGSARRYRNVMAAWPSSADVYGAIGDAASQVYSPLQFGGDPTGRTDSTASVLSALSAVLNASVNTSVMDGSMRDCGGATLDLSGGTYLLSSPLVLPAYYSNLRITQGTLRAAASFPPSSFLIECGSGGGTDSNNADVLVDEIFLDASQVAAGGLRAVGLFGGIIGPQVYVLNFTLAGINITSGHEVTVQQTWFGEFWWTDKRKENGTASVATAILIDGNDHVVQDVIAFSSKIGIAVHGGANLVSNVHTWNLANGNNGTGVLVNSSQTRVLGAYLDWNDLVVLTPTDVTISDGFYLCGGTIVLVAPSTALASNVAISNNQYIADYCGFRNFPVVKTLGVFTAVQDVTIAGTMAQDMINVVGTTATLTVTSATPTTTFTANFTSLLAFDATTVPIQTVQYSPMFTSGLFARHTARTPVDGIVTVETDVAVTGSVTISVDQSKRR